MGYGSEHEREEVTKFHSKYHTVFVYNFLFYRRRKEVMVKQCDVTVSVHVGLSG